MKMEKSKKTENRIQNMVFVAMFAAIIAVLAQIAIPVPGSVPVTLQTAAIALCGFILGKKLAPVAVCVYIALGAVGVPVFAGFKGGAAVLVGMTGGFLWGFILMAFLCGVAMRVSNRVVSIVIAVASIAACHLPGVLQFSFVFGRTVAESFLIASAPYLLKDMLSVLVAYALSGAVLHGLKKAKVTVGMF